MGWYTCPGKSAADECTYAHVNALASLCCHAIANCSAGSGCLDAGGVSVFMHGNTPCYCAAPCTEKRNGSIFECTSHASCTRGVGWSGCVLEHQFFRLLCGLSQEHPRLVLELTNIATIVFDHLCSIIQHRVIEPSDSCSVHRLLWQAVNPTPAFFPRTHAQSRLFFSRWTC